jgi:hypothetical protein
MNKSVEELSVAFENEMKKFYEVIYMLYNFCAKYIYTNLKKK